MDTEAAPQLASLRNRRRSHAHIQENIYALAMVKPGGGRSLGLELPVVFPLRPLVLIGRGVGRRIRSLGTFVVRDRNGDEDDTDSNENYPSHDNLPSVDDLETGPSVMMPVSRFRRNLECCATVLRVRRGQTFPDGHSVADRGVMISRFLLGSRC